MTAFDDIFGPLATKLIDNTFGFPVTYRVETKTYSSTTGKNTVTNTDTTVSISPPQPFDKRRVNDSTVLEEDLMTLLAAENLTITPKPGDKVQYQGDFWQVVLVKPLVSGTATAAYKLQLRK